MVGQPTKLSDYRYQLISYFNNRYYSVSIVN